MRIYRIVIMISFEVGGDVAPLSSDTHRVAAPFHLLLFLVVDRDDLVDGQVVVEEEEPDRFRLVVEVDEALHVLLFVEVALVRVDEFSFHPFHQSLGRLLRNSEHREGGAQEHQEQGHEKESLHGGLLMNAVAFDHVIRQIGSQSPVLQEPFCVFFKTPVRDVLIEPPHVGCPKQFLHLHLVVEQVHRDERLHRTPPWLAGCDTSPSIHAGRRPCLPFPWRRGADRACSRFHKTCISPWKERWREGQPGIHVAVFTPKASPSISQWGTEGKVLLFQPLFQMP